MKRAEEIVYQTVESGELTIDKQGRIWRTAVRQGDRWNGGTRVLSCQKRRAESQDGRGYLQVRAMFNGHRTYASAHRLVWHHFMGPIPASMTINHKNGDKSDNRPQNLELATYKEQTRHAHFILKRGVRDQRGQKNCMNKLTVNQVREIRTRRAAGESLLAIAKDYPVVFQTISKIAKRKAWRHCSG